LPNRAGINLCFVQTLLYNQNEKTFTNFTLVIRFVTASLCAGYNSRRGQ
jgi:hypothetical protein